MFCALLHHRGFTNRKGLGSLYNRFQCVLSTCTRLFHQKRAAKCFKIKIWNINNRLTGGKHTSRNEHLFTPSREYYTEYFINYTTVSTDNKHHRIFSTLSHGA